MTNGEAKSPREISIGEVDNLTGMCTTWPQRVLGGWHTVCVSNLIRQIHLVSILPRPSATSVTEHNHRAEPTWLSWSPHPTLATRLWATVIWTGYPLLSWQVFKKKKHLNHFQENCYFQVAQKVWQDLETERPITLVTLSSYHPECQWSWSHRTY